MKWSKESINVLLAQFPNALDPAHKIPSANEINQFLRKTKDETLRKRQEPTVRAWFHAQRKAVKRKDDLPLKNYIPNYIYGRFEKYIATGKIPSDKSCGKFLSESPSRSNMTIANIKNWVSLAIKRKSS